MSTRQRVRRHGRQLSPEPDSDSASRRLVRASFGAVDCPEHQRLQMRQRGRGVPRHGGTFPEPLQTRGEGTGT
eukprot:5951064-Pyramimonas_sp.AAC.1